jgi:hypothetical protein
LPLGVGFPVVDGVLDWEKVLEGPFVDVEAEAEAGAVGVRVLFDD